MNESHHYQVKVNWLENRKGNLQSDILDDCIEVVTPPEFAEGIPRIWTPEHLFVASVSSCLMTTFLAIAENSKLEFSSFSCNAVGKLERIDGKFRITQIMLHPVVEVADPKLVDKAIKVLSISEKACLISNSINSEIIFAPQVSVTSHATPVTSKV